ncbi:PAS domain-containing protein [Rhizobium mesosinicum]|uniref:histidine kinase n=1 Tax=Rhizobium mesosinicum TaxID=335017 RepID=A0ABS7GZN4_9HYPH|nr:PAS domain-containing protein [Rhizobium mesosinicum]MBW9055356.1 PAS domain-containing protein [Rhizobium mesosinicum]
MEPDLWKPFDILPGLVWATGPDGVTTFVNRRWREYTGIDVKELRERGWTATIHPDDIERVRDSWRDAVTRGGAAEFEMRLRRFDGVYRRFSVKAEPVHNSDGLASGWYGVNTDIESQRQAEAQLQVEKQLLELVTRGVALPEILNQLCLEVERLSPGSLCSILFSDPDELRFRMGAGPNLPGPYNAVLDGLKIDPYFGPCSLAIKTRSTIIVTDPTNDSRWLGSAWPGMMVEFGLGSCWSAPIVGSRGKVLGIFAIYKLDRVGPTDEEQELIDRFAKLSGIAMERAESDAMLAASTLELRRANRFLAGAQRLSKTGSFSLDTTTGEQVWSDENYRIWEFEPAISPTMEMVLAAIHPDDRDRAYRAFENAVRERKDVELVYRIVTPVGGVKYLHTVMEVVSEITEHLVYLGSSQDVTESRLAEAALRDSEADLARANVHLSAAQQLSQIGSFRWDSRTLELTWSDENYRIWDFDPGLAPTMDMIVKAFHPDDREATIAAIEEAARTRSAFDAYYRIVTRNGSLKYLHTVSMPVPEITDHAVFLGSTQDVTASKLAEEAQKAIAAELRRANSYLTAGQRLSKTGSFTWDAGSGEVDWSEETFRIWGIDPTVTPDMSIVLGVIHPDDLERVGRHLQEATSVGESFDMYYRIITSDGNLKHIHSVATPIPEITDRMVYIGSVQDVTETKLAEEVQKASEAELARTNAYLTAAQRLSQTGSFTWDLERDEHNWSEVIYQVFGFEPGVKVTMDMIAGTIHPEDMPHVEVLLRSAAIGEKFELMFRVLRADGDMRHAHVIGHRIAQIPDRPVFMGALQDITQRKLQEADLNHARAELAHVARVTALSALTASIAHEVSQPLAGIMTNVNTCLRMLAADPPNLDGARITAQRTLRDGDRASEVIKRLRSLFTRKPPSLELIDLNEAVREVLALSSSELQRRRVIVRTELAGDVPLVLADRVQIQQVILNLVLNAADAMAAVNDGAREMHVSSRIDPGGEISVSVRDAGIGFEGKNVEQLFQAFHTTKSDGMGIGLSVSRSIIEAHGGRLRGVSNSEGPGATFAFSIPCDVPARVNSRA